MKFRPLQGQVLVELIPYDKETAAGLVIPDTAKNKDEIGRMPAQRAKVLSLGVWPTTKKGHLIPYDFAIGNIVLVDPTMGTNLSSEQRRWKLYRSEQIIGLVA